MVELGLAPGKASNIFGSNMARSIRFPTSAVSSPIRVIGIDADVIPLCPANCEGLDLPLTAHDHPCDPGPRVDLLQGQSHGGFEDFLLGHLRRVCRIDEVEFASPATITFVDRPARRKRLASSSGMRIIQQRFSLAVQEAVMRHLVFALVALSLTVPLLLVQPPAAESACCYFAAKDKDILQPAQKAFLTFDPDKKVESFTVQPAFEGNAVDFGMVIPTPSKPTLDTMPREFFKHLAIFTILEPMDISKYKPGRGSRIPKSLPLETDVKTKVKVLDKGVVGSLEYKVLE